MMRTACLMTLMLLVVTAPAGAAEVPWEPGLRASGPPRVVFSQDPVPLGGPPSDTSFVIPPAPPATQQVAEDVMLSSAASIRRIIWWGFYDANIQPGPEERFRVRIYAPRAGDNLPNDNMILREQSFIDPLRTATGELIAVEGLPDELTYQIDLATPFEMAADTLYWFEIAQIGDIGTAFRWEFALGETTTAAINGTFTNGWEFFDFGGVALQLSTVPEPSTAALLTVFVVLSRPKRRKK